MNLYVPKVRLRRYQYPSWFTPELRHLSKCLRTTRKRVSKHPSVYQQHKLSQLEGELHSKILAAKSSHEANLIHSLRVNTTTRFMTTLGLSLQTTPSHLKLYSIHQPPLLTLTEHLSLISFSILFLLPAHTVFHQLRHYLYPL